MDKRKDAKERMLEALEQCFGVVTRAAQAAGICRTSHYKWLKEDADYSAKVEALRTNDKLLDLAESKLVEALEEGQLRAVLWVLEKKGASRGYIDPKADVQSSGGEAPIIKLEYVQPLRPTPKIIDYEDDGESQV